jgi:hypothetical protein
MTDWQKERSERSTRLNAGSRYASGKMVPPDKAKALLEAVIRPGDRVCLEGDNQKQADFLAEVLADVDRSRIHDLHIVQSGVVLQAHLDLFERGIARKLDFSYSGPQGAALARALLAGKIELGAIHTYIELFARYFMDLTPHVALIAAVQADRDGNLYTGPNTEVHLVATVRPLMEVHLRSSMTLPREITRNAAIHLQAFQPTIGGLHDRNFSQEHDQSHWRNRRNDAADCDRSRACFGRSRAWPRAHQASRFHDDCRCWHQSSDGEPGAASDLFVLQH